MTIANGTPFIRRAADAVVFGVSSDTSGAETVDALEALFRRLQDALMAHSLGAVEFVDAQLRYPGSMVPDAALVERIWRQHFAGNVPLLRVEMIGDPEAGIAELTGHGRIGEAHAARGPIFAGLDAAELEWQYSPVLWEPAVSDTLASWRRSGAEYHPGCDVLSDLRYGEGKNAVLDLYLPRSQDPPRLAIYLHGGYWQMMDKADNSHFLQGILDHGFAVANLNYDLCPTVTLADIVAQVDQACTWLFEHAQDLGYSDAGAVVIGHSAGAHLGAMMCARARGTRTESFLGGLLGISGLYDLTPLLLMPVASTLGLERADGFRGLSPTSLLPPSELRAVLALGARESDEFHAQTELLRTRWEPHVRDLTSVRVPDVAHFGVVDHLAEGVLLDAALDLLRGA